VNVMAEPGPRVLQRVAAIDVGSNTVRALAARLLSDRTLAPFHAAGKMTALGRGLSETGRLDSTAIAETSHFVASFLRECGSLDSVYCVGTAAARDASNSSELQTTLHERASVELEIISANVEGRLSFVGALAAIKDLPGSTPVVTDVGGRSTELVMREGRSLRAVSVAVGARSLTELHLASDPPARAELIAARRSARSALAEAITMLEGADALVAVGGTAQSVALLAGNRWEISLARLQELRRGLCKLPLRERRRAMVFDPPRAEIICGGMTILEALADHAPERRLHISPGGVREGLLMTRTGATRILMPMSGSETEEGE